VGRSFRTEGIILKNFRFGEIHKGVTLLSPEHGILHATAYGAYSAKGKLSNITNPLCAGTFFLYRDPVKDSVKITDLDCREFFEGIRAAIVKFFTASVWLETVIKTFGGDALEVFSLLSGSLRILDTCKEDVSPRLLVQFLWRYLLLSGAAPDTDACAGCGAAAASGGLAYKRGVAGFFCPACAGSGGAEQPLSLTAGALAYLRYSKNTSLEKAAGASVDEASFASLKKALLFLIEDLAGSPLNSIRTGAGLL